MDWLLLALVVIALVVTSKLIHFKHAKHRLFTVLIILLIAFLIFSFTSVIKGHSIDLRTAQGISSASKIYFSWFVHVADNVKEISGNVIKMDWIPKNNSMTGSAASGSGDGW